MRQHSSTQRTVSMGILIVVGNINQFASMGWKSNEKKTPNKKQHNIHTSKKRSIAQHRIHTERHLQCNFIGDDDSDERKLSSECQKSNGMCLICRYYEIQCMQAVVVKLVRVICVNSSAFLHQICNGHAFFQFPLYRLFFHSTNVCTMNPPTSHPPTHSLTPFPTGNEKRMGQTETEKFSAKCKLKKDSRWMVCKKIAHGIPKCASRFKSQCFG